MSRRGGMSVANQYEVEFDFSKFAGDDVQSAIRTNAITEINRAVGPQGSAGGSDYVFKNFCDEAQLPNISVMTGQLTGRYTGQGTVSYAHTPVFTEFQLGWMCDANMLPHKLLTAWHSYIYNNNSPSSTTNKSLSGIKTLSARLPGNRQFIAQYQDDYVCDVKITKYEMGQNEERVRPSLTYLIERAYPISVDAVPLAYGNSQLTRVTATFQYARHQIYYNYADPNSYYNEGLVRKPSTPSN